MSDEPIQPLDRATVSGIAPGSAVHARRRSPSGHWEVFWVVREDSQRIADISLAGVPEVEFRVGQLKCKAGGGVVGLVPVLLRVGPTSWESVYETWIDEYDDATSGALETLVHQNRIVVEVYGDDAELELRLPLRNSLRDFARQTLGWVSRFQPWTHEQYVAGKQRVFRDLPDTWALWRDLEPRH